MHAVPLMLLATLVTADPAGHARADGASPYHAIPVGEPSSVAKVLEQPVAANGEEEQQPFDIDPTPYKPLLGWRHKYGDEEANATIPRDDIWRRGQWSVSNLVGCTVANLGPRTEVPFTMVVNLARINCVWNPPRPNRFLRGSFEGILELDTMPVVNGPASIVIGGSLLSRYNYATHNLRKIGLYFQWGGGGMYTDAYLKGSPVLSSGFEFIIQWGLGARWMLSKTWAWNTECNFYHFSNSGIVGPNVSVNEVAIVSGLTYYFGRK